MPGNSNLSKDANPISSMIISPQHSGPSLKYIPILGAPKVNVKSALMAIGLMTPVSQFNPDGTSTDKILDLELLTQINKGMISSLTFPLNPIPKIQSTIRSAWIFLSRSLP